MTCSYKWLKNPHLKQKNIVIKLTIRSLNGEGPPTHYGGLSYTFNTYPCNQMETYEISIGISIE